MYNQKNITYNLSKRQNIISKIPFSYVFRHIKIVNNGEPYGITVFKAFLLDKTSVSISSSRFDTNYNMEEDAEIRARFGNSSAVRFVKWKRETDTGSHYIDETLPKYRGTLHGTFKQQHNIVLKIKSCDEVDAGTYFLQVFCADEEICSNKVHLQVFKGKAFNSKQSMMLVFCNKRMYFIDCTGIHFCYFNINL